MYKYIINVMGTYSVHRSRSSRHTTFCGPTPVTVPGPQPAPVHGRALVTENGGEPAASVELGFNPGTAKVVLPDSGRPSELAAADALVMRDYSAARHPEAVVERAKNILAIDEADSHPTEVQQATLDEFTREVCLHASRRRGLQAGASVAVAGS